MSDGAYKVRWAESAVRDLEEIVSYIACDSPSAARKVLARLKNRAASLEQTPLRGRLTPELARLGLRQWRELIARPYRIIYRVDNKTVHVMAMLDSRRDLEDLLLARLLRG